MKYLGYTATRFADEIGVQRSGISHILSGRNQPSYDFIVKVMNKFPEIDIEWLLSGKGELSKSVQNSVNSLKKNLNTASDNARQTNLFSESRSHSDHRKIEKQSQIVTNVNLIQKIIVLYSDGTFNHYDPVKQD